MKKEDPYILDLKEINMSMLPVVGGKAANLARLFTISGINVPEGFCVTTEAFKKAMENNVDLNTLLRNLNNVKTTERVLIAETAGQIRTIIEGTPIPEIVEEQITLQLATYSSDQAFAVRSSATAEDMPTASFAGQQDTYLNCKGNESILKHISKCWASLFTDRAIIYRIENGFDHTHVYLSVVIQKMIFPQVSGILFTADPITGNRKVVSIDASFGLGEALVSGLVTADNYKVKDGKVVNKNIGRKTVSVEALDRGGTKTHQLISSQQTAQALTDEQIIELASLGRKIEMHFGAPQDIEWCLADNKIYIVQSRPITTLFPIPKTNDAKNHVFVSVGHQQMMTDAMKPLGLSVWKLTSPRAMYDAGGRLFVDVAEELASPQKRHVLLNVLGNSDPLIKDAFMTLLERENFAQPEPVEQNPAKGHQFPDFETLADYDPSIVNELISQSESLITSLKEKISGVSGNDVFDVIINDLEERKKNAADARSFGVIMTGMNAAAWINQKMQEWLGEKAVADVLAQSVLHNVTSEMGLALLDVADAIRPYPEIIQFLEQTKNEDFIDQLSAYSGGIEVQKALNNFLDKHGIRCVGEIDITRPRWNEKPLTLVPLILSNIRNFSHGAARRKFEEGLQQAVQKETELLQRLRQLPAGDQKVKETKRMVNLLRNLVGYREYPKYHIISRYFIYKQALLKEARVLLNDNIIQRLDDIYFLTFEEFRDAVVTRSIDHDLIRRRKEEYQSYKKLTAPRVMTGDGEVITGRYKRENLPHGALIGLPVSAGVVEGRARVIVNIEDADLEQGDILVTRFTDPSWTPLFVSIKGLVTEVGGLMTHGAVIAREYGLPAVVGIDNATTIIQDKQRIRLNGTDGYVEIL